MFIPVRDERGHLCFAYDPENDTIQVKRNGVLSEFDLSELRRRHRVPGQEPTRQHQAAQRVGQAVPGANNSPDGHAG